MMLCLGVSHQQQHKIHLLDPSIFRISPVVCIELSGMKGQHELKPTKCLKPINSNGLIPLWKALCSPCWGSGKGPTKMKETQSWPPEAPSLAEEARRTSLIRFQGRFPQLPQWRQSTLRAQERKGRIYKIIPKYSLGPDWNKDLLSTTNSICLADGNIVINCDKWEGKRLRVPGPTDSPVKRLNIAPTTSCRRQAAFKRRKKTQDKSSFKMRETMD